MAIPFIVPRARFFNNDGNPLSHGRVSFYAAGTSTLKKVYLSKFEEDGNEARNPHVLNAAGQVVDGGIWLGPDPYKVVVEKFIGRDNNGDPIYKPHWSMDNIPGNGSLSDDILSGSVITTVTGLRLLEAGAYDVIYCLGHTTETDNGGGWFRWVEDEVMGDDNGAYIAPNGNPATGRWVRLFNDDTIRPEMWGAFPNRSDLTLDSNFESMILFAKNNNDHNHIFIPSGNWYLNGSVTFDGDITVETSSPVNFRNIALGMIYVSFICADVIISGSTPIIDPTEATLIFNPTNKERKAFVGWWGAVSGSGNGVYAIRQALTNTNESRVLVFDSGSSYTLSADSDDTFDFSHNILEFVNRSSIHLSVSNYVIGDFICDPDRICFYFDSSITSLSFTDKEFNIGNFDVMSSGTTISGAKYKQFLGYATVDNTRSVTLNWTSGDYVFGSTINDLPYKVNHNITGASIKFNTQIRFGSVDDCRIAGIDPTGTAYPILFNDSVSPEWFGAIPLYNTDVIMTQNVTSIKYAIGTAHTSASANLSGNCWVRGTGTYIVNAGISATGITNNVSLEINISSSSTATPVVVNSSDYFVYLAGASVDISNCNFRWMNNTTSAITLGIVSNKIEMANCALYNAYTTAKLLYTNDSNGDGNANIHDNYFASSNHNGIVVDNANASVNNNTFYKCGGDVCTMLNSTMISFSNNIVDTAFGAYHETIELKGTRSVVATGNNFTNVALRIYPDSRGVVINGNSFRSSLLYLHDPEFTTVYGNSFVQTNVYDAKIYLYAESTGWIIDELSIENNSFTSDWVPSSLTDIVELIGSGTFATYGHQANIRNNTVGTGYVEVGTEYTATYTVNANVIGASSTANLRTIDLTYNVSDKLILPSSNNIKLINAVMLRPYGKDSGTLVPASGSDAMNGEIVSLTYISSIYTSGSRTITVRVIWPGDKLYIDEGGPNEEYIAQDIRLTMQSTEV